MENLITGEIRTDISDEIGNYHFSNLAPGEYILEGHYQGHEMIINSYRDQSAIRAGQSLDSVDGAWAPFDICGSIEIDLYYQLVMNLHCFMPCSHILDG